MSKITTELRGRCLSRRMEDGSMITAEKSAADSGGGGSCGQLQMRSASCCSKPAGLLSTLADLDQRIKALLLNSHDDKDEDQAVTFAQRAEFYYHQRPQLLSLLQDLYNTYLALADRYHHNRGHNNSGAHSSSEHLLGPSSVQHNHHNQEEYQSDAESSLSYQLPPPPPTTHHNSDEIIAQLIIKNVEYDLMVNELGTSEKQVHKSYRKIQLQRSLLEVLESERLILWNENAGLRYKVGALVEENQGLTSESMFMKRKAGELARCVLKRGEDHRVCLLTRKIENLQGKIYGLEKRNHEYYQQLVKRAKTPSCSSCNGVKCDEDVEGVSSEACFQGVKLKERGVEKKGVRISKWWDKIKTSDLLFLCKPHNPSRSFGC